MAFTTMSASNNSSIAKWQKKTWVELYQQTAFGMIAASNAIYDASADFRGDRGKGDNMTFDYVGKLTNAPLGEGSVAFGNEEALDTGTHNMRINLTRIPVVSPNAGSIEQQRTNIDFQKIGAMQAAARAAELIDSSVFNQLAGFNATSFNLNGTSYSGTSRLQVQGHNTPTEPTANRVLRAGGSANDQSLGSSDTFSLSLVDFALEEITANDQPMKPCQDGYFKLLLHPYQVTDLKQDTSGAVQWYQNQLAAEQGGKESKLVLPYSEKPIHVATYANVMIYQAPRVPQGVSSADSSVVSNVRRAVMVGRDALSFASPDGGLDFSGSGTPFELYVQLSDYDYVRGIDMRCNYGVKKMSPSNAEDIGSFVISTYAAAHS